MDAESLKKEIAELEEKVFTNVDYHFNIHILEDYEDIAGFQFFYLIDDHDWYLYWLYIEKDLLSLLEFLIPAPGLMDETQKVLTFKRIVDEKLLNLTDQDHNKIYIDLELWEDPNKKYSSDTNYLRLNVFENDLEEAISIFYSYLRNHAFISNDHSVAFNRNFMVADKPIEKIIWEKYMNQLVGMLKYLIQEGYIFGDPSEIPTIIHKHFIIRRLSGSTNVESIQKTVAKVNFHKMGTGIQYNFINELAKKLDPIRAK